MWDNFKLNLRIITNVEVAIVPKKRKNIFKKAQFFNFDENVNPQNKEAQ